MDQPLKINWRWEKRVVNYEKLVEELFGNYWEMGYHMKYTSSTPVRVRLVKNKLVSK